MNELTEEINKGFNALVALYDFCQAEELQEEIVKIQNEILNGK